MHCTGVLAAEAFDEFDLSRRSLLNELTTARFWSPAGHEVTYSGDRVEAVVIDRRVFDQDLLERATSAGVAIERGARVTGVQIDAAGVTVRTRRPSIRARVCILACGANYSLHRQVGLGMPRLFLHTAQLELPARRLGDVELHFGSEIAPKGFGWVVPVARPREQCARIGVMCDGDAPRYFQRLAARVAVALGHRGRRLRPPAAENSSARADLAHVRRSAARDRRRGRSGEADDRRRHLLQPRERPRSRPRRCVDAVSQRRLQRRPARASTSSGGASACRPSSQAQTRLRLLAHRMSDADIEQLFELARTDGVMPIVRRTASFNRHRKLILALLKHPPVRQLLLRRLAF